MTPSIWKIMCCLAILGLRPDGKLLALLLAWATGSASAGIFASAETIVNTWPFLDATAAAWDVVRSGGSAVDAVLEGASTCERLQCDGTVGYGGSPDERGETTLDAMIIDGETLEMGSVGGIRNIKDAAKAAAMVKDKTKHSFLVGELAGTFAAEMGLSWSSLTTQESASLNRDWQHSDCQPNFRKGVSPDERSACGPYEPAGGMVSVTQDDSKLLSLQSLGDSAVTEQGALPSAVNTKYDALERFGQREQDSRPSRRCGVAWASPAAHDTIAMLALDQNGHIAAGTSTNGNCGKVPGRVGDAAIVGAGAYARGARGGVPGGACGATGDGDIMMRFLPCYQAVESMRQGMSPTEATEDAMRRILELYPKFQGALVAMNSTGSHGAAAVGWVFHYAVADTSSSGVPEVFKIDPLKG